MPTPDTYGRKSTGYNRRLAKVAVQCSADTFVVSQNWFSASTFVVKIATFAKRQTVMPNYKQQTTMKIIEWIFDSYFKPILLWLSAMTILFLIENAKTLSEFDFSILENFFLNNWKTILGLFILTLIFTFIIQRFVVLKKKNKRVNSTFFGFATSSNDRLLHDNYLKFNVFWAVRTINGNIHVDFVPLCPKCKTELKEKITFWNKFKWTCINCDFSIKQKDSQRNIRENVQTIAKGEIRHAGQGV